MARSWRVVVLLVVLFGVSGPYLLAAMNTASAIAVSPLDDAYITFQYARQIARGYPYQYNDGDPPTTGMTSPLFGFLLAGVYRLGFAGERIVTFAVGMGVIWLGLIAWLTYRLASRLTDGDDLTRYWAMAATIFVLLAGPVQWGCFNGMETGFFTVLTLAALDSLLAERTGLCALWLGLAALTRPEGLVLAGLVWAVSFVEGLLRSRPIQWKRLAILFTAVLVGLVPSFVNWALAGTTASAALQAKSWLFNVPRYPRETIRTTLWTYQRILTHFLGWGSADNWLVPPGLFLFSLLGCVALGLRRLWRALAVTILWFLIGTLSLATLITATWHQGRYLVPFVPITIALAVCGMSFLLGQAKRRWQRALLGLVALFLISSAIYSATRYLRFYRGAVNTMARQHSATANWLRGNLPPNARVGITDAGILRYIGERPTYDIVGLTTAGAAIAWRHGPGSVFEQMERSPMRPDCFATHPNVSMIPYLTATDLFAEELFRVEVPDHIGSAGSAQGVWRADWHLADSGEQFYQPDVLARTAGLELVDMLDVADLDDEAAHGVEWWEDIHRIGFSTEVKQFSYRVLPEREVLDGGRLLTGGIAFGVATRAGEPLWVVARLHAPDAGAVRVEVNGREVGRWAYPLVPGQWLETVFRVSAEAVTSTRMRVVLQADLDDQNAHYYAPYCFWFLQGKVEETLLEIEHPVNVVFDGDLSLLGFDLPEQMWHHGDVVPITLYWQAVAPTQSDAKVFLHLYDADGNLGPQSDGWAFHGTRPPFTWWPDEVVSDPQLLALPPDLPTGQYSLEVGLYSPDGSGRIPAYRDGVRQHEDRVPLAVIEVTE